MLISSLTHPSNLLKPRREERDGRALEHRVVFSHMAQDDVVVNGADGLKFAEFRF